VRIHLGHHFYGAGNLGDDFMLAGFLAAMRALAPGATFACSVPFPLEPLQHRFPEIEWLPYEPAARLSSIRASDVWLGLGGSPFQSAQSRWFIDHLAAEADYCTKERKPMYFLGVGVQTTSELADPAVRNVCAHAAAIWTRDPASAERIQSLPSAPRVETGADLAHLFFRDHKPPAAMPGRLTVVPNFDFAAWPGQSDFLAAGRALPVADRVWLAQESRELPGGERVLFYKLPAEERARWRLVVPEIPGSPLPNALARWPSGEWLVTGRYHAAIAGAWSGAKIVVISTNEKLRAAARDFSATLITPDADEITTSHALRSASAATPPISLAERALAACAAFARSAVAQGG
jgi:polysaccharide pyruvyl transferase WcaK-like protein